MSRTRVLLLTALFVASSTIAAADECKWVKLGYDKSHYPDTGPWCSNGWYLTQLDFDGGNDGRNFPVVGQARCCKVIASGGTNGKADSASTSEVRALQEDIDSLYREIEALTQRIDKMSGQ